ncbi:MAG: NUDIX domain-containing protein [Acidobacteria bacterium]|mgnify:CR=1 FL=1|nr:NUDIX domain-containing protein [Acidobacteriota bacterium]
MDKEAGPRFLEWAREIQALAQTECHYATDDFQRDRCRRLMQIAAEMISSGTGIDFLPLASAFNSQIGYATPKIDVRAAVFRDGKLLMVRERNDGGWTMPGGWADVGDTPARAAEREAWEEAGFRVKAQKVIGIYDANRRHPFEVFHAFKIVFLCEILDGEARPSNETTEVAFFSRGAVPSELSGERTTLRHINDAFAALQNCGRPTVFD